MRRDSNMKNDLQTVDDRVDLLDKAEKFPDLLEDAMLHVIRTMCLDKGVKDKVFGILEKWGQDGGGSLSLQKSHGKSDYEQVAKTLKSYFARVEGPTQLGYRYGDDVYESENQEDGKQEEQVDRGSSEG